MIFLTILALNATKIVSILSTPEVWGAIIGTIGSALIALFTNFFVNCKNNKRAKKEIEESRKRRIPFIQIKLINSNNYELDNNPKTYGSLMTPYKDYEDKNTKMFIRNAIWPPIDEGKEFIPIISIINLSNDYLFDLVIIINYNNSSKNNYCVYFPSLSKSQPDETLLYTDVILLKNKGTFKEIMSNKLINKISVWGITKTRDVVHYTCTDFNNPGGESFYVNKYR